MRVMALKNSCSLASLDAEVETISSFNPGDLLECRQLDNDPPTEREPAG